MIYILDDTVSQRRNEMLYLQNAPYKEVCVLVEKPTMKLIKDKVLQDFSKEGNHLLCIHKSLMFFNEEGKKLDNSDNLRNNLIKQIKEKGIKCIVFSGDVNNNKGLCFVKKDVFYRNLRVFLDALIVGNMEIDILYDGAMCKIAERKRLLNGIIDIINMECPPYDNPTLADLLLRYLGKDPNRVIELWTSKSWSKKEIRQFINDNL